MLDENDGEPPITAFDAASYTYQMTEQLRRMASDNSLEALAQALARAQVEAKIAMAAVKPC